ncbi:MAG: aldehyde dehydrogenase family protein [Acidobacteria bacterium]|nr:aldehyde dehydrogenase family protein [Acidobacteriota bacterium]
MSAHLNLIAGEWRASVSGRTFENRNPADTEDLVGTFPESSAADVALAVDAARAAQPGWAAIPAPKRGDVLYRAATILESRADDITRTMTREEGKTLPEARGEVGRTINILRYYGGEGARLFGRVIPSERDRVFVHTLRAPLGVVGAITPWNFPIAIPAWKACPALVSGNAVVLKPSELAPLCATRLAEILVEAGLPAGVLNVVNGAGEAGKALVAHEQVRAISFTGSETTGSAVAETCGRRRARVQLEMGGKNPTIVLADADLDEAAAIVLNAAFGATGQRCTATSRAIVERSVAGAFADALVAKARAMTVGPGNAAGVDVGPSIDARHADRVVREVAAAAEAGARVRTGGTRLTDGMLARGHFVAPTVLDDVTPAMGIAQDEVFGPVVAILPADDFEHALALANDVRFGLSAAICTHSLSHALQFAQRVDAGMVMVNLPSAGVEYQVAFGGSKASSLGPREQGPEAIDFYTTLKTVYVKY